MAAIFCFLLSMVLYAAAVKSASSLRVLSLPSGWRTETAVRIFWPAMIGKPNAETSAATTIFGLVGAAASFPLMKLISRQGPRK